jgi:hypothetical protein
MHGHTGGHVPGGHIPPPHQVDHQSAHRPSDAWNTPPAPRDRPLLQNLATVLIRDRRVIGVLITLTITVVLLVLFTF